MSVADILITVGLSIILFLLISLLLKDRFKKYSREETEEKLFGKKH